jgi:hypothetical protein
MSNFKQQRLRGDMSDFVVAKHDLDMGLGQRIFTVRPRGPPAPPEPMEPPEKGVFDMDEDLYLNGTTLTTTATTTVEKRKNVRATL